MEEMKWDMGGSAVVTALMNLLSSTNPDFTYAGIIGLVENMPSGTAYKPGDIIKSYKGINVEVLNTDAEGRLVLADCITYGSELYKPKLIIDFATLTGAILIALGQNYAGLFSNDDDLSDQLYKSGINTNEKVWRMPMDSDFDKMMSSQFVDLKIYQAEDMQELLLQLSLFKDLFLLKQSGLILILQELHGKTKEIYLTDLEPQVLDCF
jgi:leucyl aminopeptidase